MLHFFVNNNVFSCFIILFFFLEKIIFIHSLYQKSIQKLKKKNK